jgi:hypothetical protein
MKLHALLSLVLVDAVAPAFAARHPMMLDDLRGFLRSSGGYQAATGEFDLDAVDAVERFYLDVLAGKESVPVSEARLDRVFIAYIGEAIQAHVGGKWELNDLKADAAYGTPIILGWGSDPDAMRISPVELRERIKRQRTPGILRGVIEYAVLREKEYQEIQRRRAERSPR